MVNTKSSNAILDTLATTACGLGNKQAVADAFDKPNHSARTLADILPSVFGKHTHNNEVKYRPATW